MSVLLRVAYDGSDFHGFARQPGLRTVQGELEAALSAAYRSPMLLRGASRTDAGVHAKGQLVAFDPPFTIPLSGLLENLGGRLSADLGVLDAWEEFGPEGQAVQPRFDNLGKRYRYRIDCARHRDPFVSRFAWHNRYPLDVQAMRKASRCLLGEQDFSSFRAKDCQAAHARRRIESILFRVYPHLQRADLRPRGGPESSPRAVVEIDVAGTAFLKHMVRILVGTMVEVGRRRKEPAWIEEVLRARDRRVAGPTAPAKGLTLLEVRWPKNPRHHEAGPPSSAGGSDQPSDRVSGQPSE